MRPAFAGFVDFGVVFARFELGTDDGFSVGQVVAPKLTDRSWNDGLLVKAMREGTGGAGLEKDESPASAPSVCACPSTGVLMANLLPDGARGVGRVVH